MDDFNLINDVNLNSMSDGKIYDPSNRREKCPTCGKLYPYSVMPYKCPKCGQLTKTVTVVKRHCS